MIAYPPFFVHCAWGGGVVFRYPKVATIPKWVAALWKNVE